MIVRRHAEVEPVDWGNGFSRRFLVAADGLGYTVTDTIVHAGTSSRLAYRSHLEACYCISGRGHVIDADGTVHDIGPGTMYALDRHDPHTLVADEGEDLRLVCMFSPALRGDERHELSDHAYSQY
jgi:L-ectoine synthase